MNLSRHPRFRKLGFYGRGFLEQVFLPDVMFRRQLEKKLAAISDTQEEEIWRRVNYYNKLEMSCSIPREACRLSDLSMWKKSSYFYDFRKVMRFFDSEMRTAQRFGDVRDVSDHPRIVKTRPIQEPHDKSILLKLNSIRHFRPTTDPVPYDSKRDQIVWRGKVKRDHRQDVFRQHFDHPLCDLGKTNILEDDENLQWKKPFLSIQEQLNYKFILSIEGNEVATNLKWIAQSNSLCLMTRPKFESWFMEGTLKPSVHYVELRDDYSDLPEKMAHFLDHPDDAKEIIGNLNQYYRPFENEERELLISLMVVRKYLEKTGQLGKL